MHFYALISSVLEKIYIVLTSKLLQEVTHLYWGGERDYVVRVLDGTSYNLTVYRDIHQFLPATTVP
jgi:hypothetical protein